MRHTAFRLISSKKLAMIQVFTSMWLVLRKRATLSKPAPGLLGKVALRPLHHLLFAIYARLSSKAIVRPNPEVARFWQSCDRSRLVERMTAAFWEMIGA